MEFKPFIQIWIKLVMIAGQWWLLSVFEGLGGTQAYVTGLGREMGTPNHIHLM